ncbi:PKD domain-containing protein [Paracoccus zhejiangensis]|nr:autotransporter domain-containing protein [Paracoccus zhejiangensis]
MGVIFDAITPEDPVTYRYELALSGLLSTSFINTRVAVEHPPTAVAGPDQSLASGDPGTLDGSASSANDAGQSLTYAWTQTGGAAVSLDDATSVAPAFIAPTLNAGDAPEVLSFSLIVNDGIASSTADTVQITVTPPPNTQPTANAGPDQTVASGDGVTLDGSASSANDAAQSLTYAWVQTGGTTVSLSNASIASPGFTAPTLNMGDTPVVLSFSLVVNDGIEDSVADTVEITVTPPPSTPPPNIPPTASAGPDQSLASGAAGTLDGSASSANDGGQSLTYAWTQTGGTAVSLGDATSVTPGFTAPTLNVGDAPMLLTFSLVVHDGVEASPADTVQITVTPPPNTAPTASAGTDQTLASGAGVTLDGSASSANDAGQSLTYAWTQTGGTAVTLDNASVASPGFSAPTLAVGAAPEVLTFSLVVNDGVEDSTADTIQITVTPPPNTPPTASAGPGQTLASGASAMLDGSASSANDAGQTLTYLWTQTDGPTVVLSDATSATPSFTAPTVPVTGPMEMLVFCLVVNDGIATSAPNMVRITVTAEPNTPPTADAGPPQTVASGSTVTLDAGASSANDTGQSLTYLWTQTAGPAVVLDDPTSPNPRFDPPVLPAGSPNAVLTFQLTVDDGVSVSAQSTVQITIQAAANTLPTARAGGDLEVASGAVVRLDGGASSANDTGQSLSYLWTQTDGPSVVLSGDDQPIAQFTAPLLEPGEAAEALSFSLSVHDGIDPSPTDSLRVMVLPPGDATPPTAELAYAGDSFVPGDTITITIRFSEPVSGLVAGDLRGNGRVVSLSGSGASYSARITTPATGESLTVALPEGAAEDAAGNPSLAAPPLTIRANLAEMAREVAAQGMTARGRALIAAQPKLRSYFDPGGGTGDAMMLAGSGTIDIAYVSEAGWWINAKGEWSDIEGAESDYVNLALGAHLHRETNNLIGAMLQLDRSKTDVSEPMGRFEGDGWLVGPYWVGRMADQPLVFSASALWGQIDNTVTLPGLTEDDVEGKRWLMTAGIEGRHGIGNGAVLIPSLDLSHLKDSLDAYRDRSGDAVAGQQVIMTEAEFGLGLEVPIAVKNGVMTLSGGLSGTYSRTRALNARREDWRGGIELVVDYDMVNRGWLRLAARYDGIGQDDYEACSVDLTYRQDF